MDNQKLYDKVYEDTKDYGRAQFVKALVEKDEENKELREVIDKLNSKLNQYRNDLKAYQEQDRINHQNVSIGLVGVKIRAFEDILKEVE